MNSKLLPLGEMASRLGLQTKALREEAMRGGVPSVRVGDRGLLFDEDAVLAALKARATDARPQDGQEVRDGTT